MNKARMRLGDLLISAKVLSVEQLHTALLEQQRYGGRLGSTLMRLGFVSEELMVKALAKHLQIPDVDPLKCTAPMAVLARFPKESWERMLVFPVGFDEAKRVLILATFDPLNQPILDEISRIMGTQIEPRIAGESRILAALQQAFSAARTPVATEMHWQKSLAELEQAASSNVDAVLALLELSAEKGLAAPAEAALRAQQMYNYRTPEKRRTN